MKTTVIRRNLSNDTRVLLIPRPDAASVILHVAYAVGSRDEPEEIAGIAHGIEHIGFKGTPKRQNATIISRDCDRVGGEHNAFTSEETTGYYMHVDASHFALAADMMADTLLHSLFRAEDVRSEREVIVEEARGRMADPEMLVDELLHGIAFEGDPLAHPVIGRIATIRAFDREKLLAFKEARYGTSNMVITVAGKFHEGMVLHALEDTFGRAAKRHRPRLGKTRPMERQKAARLRYVRTASVEQAVVALGFQTGGRDHRDRFALAMLCNILGGTSSSRLFDVIRNVHNLSYNPASYTEGYHDAGLLCVTVSLAREHARKGITLIMDELLRIRDEGVTELELKDSQSNMRGTYARQFEDAALLAGDCSSQELHMTTPLLPEERLARMDAVTRQDVRRVARQYIRAQGANLAVQSPADDKRFFAKQLARL